MGPAEKSQDDSTDAPTPHYGYKKDLRTAMPQVIAVSVKNLLLLGKSTFWGRCFCYATSSNIKPGQMKITTDFVIERCD